MFQNMEFYLQMTVLKKNKKKNCTLNSYFLPFIFQLDFVNDLLQELSSTSDAKPSGEESTGEENKKEDVDEDDLAEQAKLPQYASRFKVGIYRVQQWCFCLGWLLD